MTHPRILISNGNPMEETVGPGDVFAQTTQCFKIIEAALDQAGSGLLDIVRTRVILTDIDNWKPAIEARKAYCRDARPVDTIMAVTRFVNPEWLVEIEVDAVVAH